jgi:probable F420-dependent oxidoreductase
LKGGCGNRGGIDQERKPMKVGVAYPQTEVAGDPDAVRRYISVAEELGYEYLLAYDHVVKASHDREPKLNGPYTENHSFHDPFVLFGFAAAVTDRLEFATGVLILPQRQTALVAQQAADVDLLSKERFRLSVGIGWNYVEYAALGQDFRTRAKRIEEQVGLLRQLWTTPLVTFEGRFDSIDRAGINPRPKRRIPIWIGGYTEPAYERGARIGEGFIFAGDAAGCIVGWQRVQHHLHALGRPEDGFGRELLALTAANPQQAADHLRAWRDAGGTHGCVPSMEKGLGADIDAHIAYIAEVRRCYSAG